MAYPTPRAYDGVLGEGSIPVPLPPPLIPDISYFETETVRKSGRFRAFFSRRISVACQNEHSMRLENAFFSES